MKNLIIIGLSDVADRFIRIVERHKLFNVIGCAVDRQYLPNTHYMSIGGGKRAVWGIEDLDLHINKNGDLLFVAMLFNHLNADRKKLYQRLKDQGYKFANIISPLASVRTDAVGDNCFIGDFVVIHEGATIGNNVIIKDLSVIGAYSVVANHCFISGGTAIGGGCHIGEETFLGMNSTIYTGNRVGEKCLINAGIPINKDIPDFAMVTCGKQNYNIRVFDREIMNESIVAHRNII